MQYTATVQVTLPQLVQCRHCDCQFVYEMTVKGTGFAETSLFVGDSSARESAAEGAHQSLMRKLDNFELCDPVPCPKCFCYQPYMYQKLAKAKYEYIGSTGLVLLALGIAATALVVFLGFVSPAHWRVLACVGAATIAVTALGFFLRRWMHRLITEYDPNKGQALDREDKAGARARSLEAFDEMQSQRVRDAYRKHTGAPVMQPQKRNPWDVEREPKDQNPWATDAGTPSGEPLIVSWWVVPSMFMDGGLIAIDLTSDQRVAVQVPESAKPGDALPLQLCPEGVVPFQVRIMAIRVHPEEMRLE